MSSNQVTTQGTSQGSFLNGFIVGLFAGAAGYFLFGTKKGETIRHKINEEWEQAKVQLSDQGVIESSDMTIREFLASIVEKISLGDLIDTNSSKSAKTQVKSSKSSKLLESFKTSKTIKASPAPKRRLFKNS
jgi:gas vesicle protein